MDLQFGQWKSAIDFLVVPVDSWNIVICIDFFYESNEAVNMKANVLMIMGGASPCMVSFMREMPIGIALSSMWVIKTSEPHEGIVGNGVSKARTRVSWAMVCPMHA